MSFRIIPAYAGSTIGFPPCFPQRRDHPRIRGEHAGVAGFGATAAGSSPHTRGAHHVEVAPQNRVRIIPAYAGSTISDSDSPRDSSDHPRIRGEHRCWRLWRRSGVGSSPHTRGAHELRRRGYDAIRIIPAYAGSTYERAVKEAE